MADILNFNALRVYDTNGLPAGGAKVYFYEEGTTTPATVYSDKAGETAHPSPLVADAEGYLPNVFGLGSAGLSATVKDSNDVALYTMNPIRRISTSTSGAAQITFAPTASLDSENVQAAIEAVDAKAEAAVPEVRQVTAGGLATGGGTLEVNRTITVPAASNAETIAGTVTDKAVTPAGHKAALDAAITLGPVIFANINGTGGAVTRRAEGAAFTVTRTAAGTYTFTITTALAANYTVQATAGDATGNRLAAQVNVVSTTEFRVYVINHGNGAFSDAEFLMVTVYP